MQVSINRNTLFNRVFTLSIQLQHFSVRQLEPQYNDVAIGLVLLENLLDHICNSVILFPDQDSSRFLRIDTNYSSLTLLTLYIMQPPPSTLCQSYYLLGSHSVSPCNHQSDLPLDRIGTQAIVQYVYTSCFSRGILVFW